MRLISALFVLAGAGMLIWLGLPKVKEWRTALSSPIASPSPVFVDRPTSSHLQITARVTDGDVSRAITCYQGSCRPLAYPGGVVGVAVSDGQAWFYYEAEKDEKKGWKRQLVRLPVGSSGAELITESTPLTEPRDLFISPDNRKVAFYLDNIHEPSKRLTELWVYDTDNKGVRLLAEKLFRPDIRSALYWNSASTYAWFVGDTGDQKDPEDKLALVVIGTDSSEVKAVHGNVDWSKLIKDGEKLRADISPDGNSLAYVKQGFLGQDVLAIAEGDSQEQSMGLRGSIVYVQWLDDETLLYAVQDRTGFTFWQHKDGTHRFIARRAGVLGSAYGGSDGAYVTFSVDAGNKTTRIYSLHVSTGTVIDDGVISEPLSAIYIANAVTVDAGDMKGEVESVSDVYDDAELAAFIERQLGSITGDQSNQPIRLIVTDKENTLLIDYRTAAGKEERLLVKVHDVIHVDWSIRARYQAVNGQWKRMQGGGAEDPKPLRLYEWEQQLKRWILKENYSNG